MRLVNEYYKKSHRKPKVGDQVYIINKYNPRTNNHEYICTFHLVVSDHNNGVCEIETKVAGSKKLFDETDEFYVFEPVSSNENF